LNLLRRLTRPLVCLLVLAALAAAGSGRSGSWTAAQSLSGPAATPPAAGRVLWSADHETGDLSQWTAGDGGGAFNSGTGEVRVSQVVAHSGRHSLALSIRDADGQPQAARIFRWAENPAEAYYSAWLFFPERFEIGRWWDVFQFKSPDQAGVSQPAWVLNVGNLPTGEMVFYLWDALSRQAHQAGPRATAVPVGRWVHVEAFYRRSTGQAGRIAVWQDGVRLLDRDGVRTALSESVQWSLANYTDWISPRAATIYADDAVISTARVGPTEPGAALGRGRVLLPYAASGGAAGAGQPAAAGRDA
jgi:hypothetical protein